MSGFGWVRYNTARSAARARSQLHALPGGEPRLRFPPGDRRRQRRAGSRRNRPGLRDRDRLRQRHGHRCDRYPPFPDSGRGRDRQRRLLPRCRHLGQWEQRLAPFHGAGGLSEPGSPGAVRTGDGLHPDPLGRISTYADFIAPPTVVYSNDFETNTTGWTHGYTTGSDDWRWAAPRTFAGQWDPLKAASGSKCFGTDLNETTGGTFDGLYPNSAANYLESPVINCAGQMGCSCSSSAG